MRSKPTFVKRFEEEERLALDRWKRDREKVYSEEDMMAFIEENVRVCTEYCFHDWFLDIVKLIRKRCRTKRGFCIVNDGIYCNEYGYQKLMEYFSRREMLKTR